MTLLDTVRSTLGLRSRYASLSVERQGKALRRATIEGTLQDFTPADWAVFIDSGALEWKDDEQTLFLHKTAWDGCLDQIPHQVWGALIAQDLLKEKDDHQRLFLHLAALRGHLKQIPHQVWEAMITQDLLKEKDDSQVLFLHWAVGYGHLDQVPHYVFAAMRPERDYSTEFWLSKTRSGKNILDCAALWDNGKYFPKALIPALWQGRVAILHALWDQMNDGHKEYPGVKEAYERFLLHPMLRPQKKGLVLR